MAKQLAKPQSPRRLVPLEQSLKVSSHVRNQGSNTGVLTASGWRATWVAKRNLDNSRRLGVILPELGDERVLNGDAYQVHEMNGKRYLGRADSIIGLVRDELYAQYLLDLRAEQQRGIDAEGGSLKMTTITAEQYERETASAAEHAALALAPPPITAPQGAE
jgi:hypothetical protein